MKILVVAGFLGSGKTTFLRQLCQHLDDVVILENEIAHDVDRELLSNAYERLYSIDEGCACCTSADQFEQTIISIAAGVNPNYLVIEPTGIAKLSAVIKRINKITYERIQYAGSLAIVELDGYQSVLETYREVFLDTLENSDLVLFSKSEHASLKDFNRVIQRLSQFTDTKMSSKHYTDFTAQDWMAIKSLSTTNKLVEHKAHLKVDTLSFHKVHFENQHQMSSVFNALMTGRFGNILRAKGGFTIGDCAYKLDIVRGDITVEKTVKPLSKCVFIGENLDLKAFNTLFKQYYKQ